MKFMSKSTLFLLAILATAAQANAKGPARDWKQTDWLPHQLCQSAGHCLEIVEIRYPDSRPLKGVALLIPGFTQNARFWDLSPERRISYARHLMDEQGLKVYLLNVNGIGNSDRTRHGNMDNIAMDDIPAALEFV